MGGRNLMGCPDDRFKDFIERGEKPAIGDSFFSGTLQAQEPP